jgi:hypothetical protein
VQSILDRLAAKSTMDGECVVWTGTHTTAGYGRILIEGQLTYTHRAARIARNGPIPQETPYVLHHCDNPPCWADNHLFLGTQADNVRDMWAKGRGKSNATLTDQCRAGHPWTERNTWVRSTGQRVCRECKARRQRDFHAKDPVKHNLARTERRRASKS